MSHLRNAMLALGLLLSLGVAGYAVFSYALLPLGVHVRPEMRASFEANAVAVYVHVFGSAVALALGPLQFVTVLRTARPAAHRWVGRSYLGIGVLSGGLAGLYLSLHAFGGVVAQLGFAFLAIAWLQSGLLAYLAIREGDVTRHRRWMVRNFALTFAAVTLRLYLPASAGAGLGFGPAYAAIAWLCWVPNLVVAEWIVRSLPEIPEQATARRT
jgi:uncharacterized membrane protein